MGDKGEPWGNLPSKHEILAITFATALGNLNLWFFSRYPFILPKWILGKKSFISTLITYFLFLWISELVNIDFPFIYPCDILLLSSLCSSWTLTWSNNNTPIALCISFNSLLGAFIVRIPPVFLGIENSVYIIALLVLNARSNNLYFDMQRFLLSSSKVRIPITNPPQKKEHVATHYALIAFALIHSKNSQMLLRKFKRPKLSTIIAITYET